MRVSLGGISSLDLPHDKITFLMTILMTPLNRAFTTEGHKVLHGAGGVLVAVEALGCSPSLVHQEVLRLKGSAGWLPFVFGRLMKNDAKLKSTSCGCPYTALTQPL